MVISGHVTKMAVAPFDLTYSKTPFCTQTPWFCVLEPQLLLIEVLHCGNIDFLFYMFFFCDLDLESMTFIYELNPYPVRMYLIFENELSMSRLSKVIVL